MSDWDTAPAWAGESTTAAPADSISDIAGGVDLIDMNGGDDNNNNGGGGGGDRACYNCGQTG